MVEFIMRSIAVLLAFFTFWHVIERKPKTSAETVAGFGIMMFYVLVALGFAG